MSVLLFSLPRPCHPAFLPFSQVYQRAVSNHCLPHMSYRRELNWGEERDLNKYLFPHDFHTPNWRDAFGNYSVFFSHPLSLDFSPPPSSHELWVAWGFSVPLYSDVSESSAYISLLSYIGSIMDISSWKSYGYFKYDLCQMIQLIVLLSLLFFLCILFFFLKIKQYLFTYPGLASF